MEKVQNPVILCINLGSIIKIGDIPFAEVKFITLSFVTTSEHVAGV
jgi:hypothetical protein